MSVNNISNNNAAAQLQLYGQQKPAPATLNQQNTPVAANSTVKLADSVQISEQAKALLSAERRAADTAVTTLTNGMGIEPPKTSSVTTLTNGMGIEPPKANSVTTLTNGMGIEPPKMSGATIPTNGMGIEPPKTGNATTLTNGMGIEPPQGS